MYVSKTDNNKNKKSTTNFLNVLHQVRAPRSFLHLHCLKVMIIMKQRIPPRLVQHEKRT